jgi:hypothetical protein
MSNNVFPDPANVAIVSPTETSDRGTEGVAVFIQDQTTGILDVPFLNNLSTPTLAIDTVADGINRDITLTAGHGLTVADIGNIVEIVDSANGTFFMQAAITNVVADVITLDAPINRIYTTTQSILSVSDIDMNVNGAVTPVIYSVLPFSIQKGDMVRLIVEIRDNSPMDFETFGGVPALANGCVLRINNGDGTYRNLYNFKSNGDMIEQGFDHDFFLNNGGNIRGFTCRITWGGQSKHGAVIRLDGSLGEALEFVIQDDLTGLTRMHWTAQGSEVQD